jgi:hypothetical protein
MSSPTFPGQSFMYDCPKGWKALVEPLIKKCEEKGLVILQIKEKFGGLRFYCEVDDEMSELVHKAEQDSYKICEVCGNPGVLRSGGWIQTLCDEHAEGREAFKNEGY